MGGFECSKGGYLDRGINNPEIKNIDLEIKELIAKSRDIRTYINMLGDFSNELFKSNKEKKSFLSIVAEGPNAGLETTNIVFELKKKKLQELADLESKIIKLYGKKYSYGIDFKALEKEGYVYHVSEVSYKDENGRVVNLPITMNLNSQDIFLDGDKGKIRINNSGNEVSVVNLMNGHGFTLPLNNVKFSGMIDGNFNPVFSTNMQNVKLGMSGGVEFNFKGKLSKSFN